MFGFFVITVSALPIFAEEEEKPVPGVVYAIWTNPFYFGEVGLGPSILVYMEQPLDSYLVPGTTTNDTPLPEVVDEYLKSVEEKSAQVIVSEEDRPMFYSVIFSGGPIQDEQEFTSFSLFQPLRIELPTRTPYGYDITREGFLLESLITPDKQILYEKLVTEYFEDFEYEKFDVTIEPVTKDGTILQSWEYKKCELEDYSVYLNELLGTLKFNKTIRLFGGEILDLRTFDPIKYETKAKRQAPNFDNSYEYLIPDRIESQFDSVDFANQCERLDLIINPDESKRSVICFNPNYENSPPDPSSSLEYYLVLSNGPENSCPFCKPILLNDKITSNIPDWVRNTAKWWSLTQISDQDFAKGLEYLIQNDVIQVPENQPSEGSSESELPSWLQKNAGWWSQNLLSNDEFFKSIQWLINNGFIKI